MNAARLCAENLFEILNATLEYSSLEAGQFSLDESEFSLREILDAAVAQHARQGPCEGPAALFDTWMRGCPRPCWAMGPGCANCSAI